MSTLSAASPQSPIDPKASPTELADDIDVILDRLGSTIDQLVDRANPKNIVRRKLDDVKAHFVAADGSVRIENVVPVVVGTVAVLGTISLLRRITR